MAKAYKSAPADIIVNELVIRSTDRGKKDIATWRGSLMSAESVYYPNRSRLYDLYEDIILDGHLSGIIAKRMNAVLNKELHFEANGTRIAKMDELIHSLAFRDIVRTIMETQLWGISGLEFIPGSTLAFQAIPRKHIKPEQGIIAWEQSGTDGIAYADLENIWVMGENKDLGLLLKCAPYCLYKRGGIADWAQYIELFGQPVRIIKYDSYDEQTRAELKKILDESGSSLSLMIPRQADFEIKDGKQTNCDGNLQLSFIKSLNEEMSITILGNTETTSSSYSTGYAQSKVHLEQQYEITRSDLVYTAAMLNSKRFLSILAAYGYPIDNGAFVFTKDMDVDYLKTRIAIDKEVAQMVPIADSYWYDTYGIPAGK
jgi:phage gp29-like protein